MKKFIITFMSLLFCLVMCCFSACGCSGCTPATTLSFTSNWNNQNAEGGKPSVGFYEKTEYEVKYNQEFVSGDYKYNMEPALSTLNYSFSNGRYVSTVSVVSSDTIKQSIKVNNPDAESNIIINEQSYFKLETEFTITFNFQTETYNDSVKSVTYFAQIDSSLAPIYNFTEYDMHVLHLDETASVKASAYTTETLYQQNSYTSKINVTDGQSQEKTYNYTFKTLIDNGELLFALRNIDISLDAEASLPTCLPAYGVAQTLSVKCYDKSDMVINSLTVNGTNFTDATITTSKLAYRNASTTTSGKEQLVFIQSAEIEGTLKNRATVVKYVEPLTSDGVYKSMGCLEYNLTSISYGQA